MFSIKIFSQDYHSTLGDNNEWYIVQSFEITYTDVFSLGETKTINEKTYREFGHFGPELYIREDTVERKIYMIQWRNDESHEEYVMYDFSINEGDTIDLFIFLGSPVDTLENFVVDSIRDINTSIDTRKIFYLSGKYSATSEYTFKSVWIEGIGSLGNFLCPGYDVDEWNYGALSCFFKDNVKVYHSPDYNSCTVVGIDTYESNIQIFPNPAKDYIIINLDSEKLVDLRIMDLLGRIVYIENSVIPINKKIDLSLLKKGNYILSISNANLLMTRLIVK